MGRPGDSCAEACEGLGSALSGLSGTRDGIGCQWLPTKLTLMGEVFSADFLFRAMVIGAKPDVSDLWGKKNE